MEGAGLGEFGECHFLGEANSVKQLNYWIVLAGFQLKKVEAYIFHFTDKISEYFT